ncbi:MAG: glycosyltransferase family 2 protein [Candidatus Moranbacteria bacterium]|nr:glycosyltransferase family 2 protein [Candidatus Moranbacteria bacterium]
MDNNQNPRISVVIPTYNEEKRKEAMEKHLKSIGDHFDRLGLSYEIVIALDGPTDKTPELVKSHQSNLKNIVVIDRKENKGKGFTVREGMMKARGEIRIFTDMDGATPINMIDRFIPKFKEGFDIVIGSRDLEESDVKVSQPIWKVFLGNTGNLLIQFIGGLWGMKDTQCGFKAFTKKATEDIIPRTTVDRWGLDFELLMIGKKRGYKISEVPVEWIDSGDSLVGISGYISTFRDLFNVRWNMIKGVYQLDKSVEEMKK